MPHASCKALAEQRAPVAIVVQKNPDSQSPYLARLAHVDWDSVSLLQGLITASSWRAEGAWRRLKSPADMWQLVGVWLGTPRSSQPSCAKQAQGTASCSKGPATNWRQETRLSKAVIFWRRQGLQHPQSEFFRNAVLARRLGPALWVTFLHQNRAVQKETPNQNSSLMTTTEISRLQGTTNERSHYTFLAQSMLQLEKPNHIYIHIYIYMRSDLHTHSIQT